ncbi:MAG: hypothetical protein KC502_15170 [Myxococcales bacterium]|nr:hypothetical protein [Myxococcales bacterium]
MSKYDLRQVTVRGTPTEMGAGQGEAFRDLISDFIEMRFDAVQTFFGELGRGNLSELLDVGRQGLHHLEGWHKDGFDEHMAVAAAAGVDPVSLFTTGNMTDTRDGVVLNNKHRGADVGPADAEGCSLVLVPGARTVDGSHVVGQTWDLNPRDLDYVVGVHRVPTNAPETWSVTVSGCPSLVGMNSAGICTGTTNIKTWGARVGVGYMNILHKVLSQSRFDAAASVIEQAPRSGAHTYWLADGERISDWETTPASFVRRDAHAQPLWRTNHCINHAHQVLEGEAASASSLARYNRIGTTLDKHNMSVERMQQLFADRTDGVDSINRYEEDEQGTATNSVLVMVPERLELWACRGNADRGQWHRLRFEFAGSNAP